MSHPTVSIPIRLPLHRARRNSRRTARRLVLVALALIAAAGLAWALRPVVLGTIGWLTRPVLTALTPQILPPGLIP
jgi:hypothetical protein